MLTVLLRRKGEEVCDQTQARGLALFGVELNRHQIAALDRGNTISLRHTVRAGMSLYGSTGERKYLNAAERRRFMRAARRAAPKVRLFYLLLRWSGNLTLVYVALGVALAVFGLTIAGAVWGGVWFRGRNDRAPKPR